MIYLENLILFNRLIIRDAARHLDEKSPKAASLCALAKLHGTESCFEVSYMNLVLLNSIFEFEFTSFWQISYEGQFEINRIVMKYAVGEANL